MRTIQLSFAGGEVSPEMLARPDTRQYVTGAERIRNYLPLPQGPVTRRPGSRYVAGSLNNNAVRLLPFIFSTDQALVIELSPLRARFHVDGATLLWAEPRNAGEGAWNLTANTLTFLDVHRFATNDIIKMVSDGGVIPTGLDSLLTYYAIVVDSHTIQFSLTSGGAAIDLSGSPTGYVRVYLVSDMPDLHVVPQAYEQGDLVRIPNGGVAYCLEAHTSASGTIANPAYWAFQPQSGDLVITTPYTADDLESVNYAQSNDIVTLTHPSYAPRELRRLGATHWVLQTITFGSTLTVPIITSVTANRGATLRITNVSGQGGSTADYTFATAHNLAIGDAVWNELSLTQGPLFANTYYIVDTAPTTTVVTFRTVDGFRLTPPAVNAAVTGRVYYASLSANNEQIYKVTAVDSNNIETVASASVAVDNNIDVPGSSNTITWGAVAGAERYRIYRDTNGLFAYIGESESTSFVDDGISASLDLGRTPPIQDDSLSGSDYPRAVGYFEQRRCFAGTVLKPRQLWMTKSGTESDMTYSLPIQDDDRISVVMAAREAETIRHIVSLNNLVMLGRQGEWSVTALNSDAITPETVAVRQQSEVGCSFVRPEVVNNSIVFASNRGGHVRAMNYSWQAQGYTTTDLSLRATHLFDGLTIRDSSHSKAPYPVLWFVSSSGKLLSLTFVPDEEVAGWAVHDFGDDVFVESVCAIPEGDQDSIYIATNRTESGLTKRYVERLIPTVTESLVDGVYLDASTTFDGLEEYNRAISVSGGRLWTRGESVTMTASAFGSVSAHTFRSDDVGDEVELYDADGVGYRIRITRVTSSTVATGTLRADLPASLRSTWVSDWAFGRRTFPIRTSLEGLTVSIVADGVILADQVVTDGAITLTTPAVKVHVGFGYTSTVKTLPLALQTMDGAGQGRMKNIGKVFARVLDSAGMQVGPDESLLVPFEGLPSSSLSTGERRATLPGSWASDGSVVLQQSEPLPSTILGLTLQLTVGD